MGSAVRIAANRSVRVSIPRRPDFLETALRYARSPDPEWRPPVLRTIAVKSEGVGAVVDWIGKHRAYLEANDLLKSRERARVRAELEMVVQRELMARLLRGVNGAQIETLVAQIAARELDVYAAAESLLHHTA